MSTLMISMFFALGVSAFAYSKLGRRTGYGNAQNVWIITSIAFVITFIFFFTLFKYVI